MPAAKQTDPHSPLPWTLYEESRHFHVTDREGIRLMQVGSLNGYSQCEKNAQLICTAVNQHAANLEAIRELRAALVELADASMDFRLHSTAHPRLVAADTAARAALAKHPQS